MIEGDRSFNHFESLILVAGIAGAGKSTAMATLADNGYFVVENLPVQLLDSFFKLTKDQSNKFAHTALLLDIESSASVNQLIEIIQKLKAQVLNLQLLFLDAKDDVLIKRYNETRRPHPEFDPTRDRSLLDTIKRHKTRLLPLKERANLIVDTSESTVHDLRREIENFIRSLKVGASRAVRLNFVSFGYKYGLPLDCDLIMDVRFLPNPHFIEELREKTGLDAAVKDYVLSSKATQDFLQSYTSLLDFLIPHFIHEGKTYINVGLGCTGGKHRSVAIAEALMSRVKPNNILISVKHRDYLKS